MAFERVKTLESLWSLANLVWEQIVRLGLYGAGLAMLTAVGAVLYSAAAWINQFRAAGWILAIVAAIIVGALLVGIVAWAIDRVRVIRSERSKASAASASAALYTAKRIPLDQVLGKIDRTLFLLTARTIDQMHLEMLESAVAQLPKLPESGPNIPDDTDRIVKLIAEALGNLGTSHWRQELSGELGQLERNADYQLKTIPVPDGVAWYDFRANYIARQQFRRVEIYLQGEAQQLRNNQGQMLSMLYERRAAHDGKN
jgi:hypothetical protein